MRKEQKINQQLSPLQLQSWKVFRDNNNNSSPQKFLLVLTKRKIKIHKLNSTRLQKK